MTQSVPLLRRQFTPVLIDQQRTYDRVDYVRMPPSSLRLFLCGENAFDLIYRMQQPRSSFQACAQSAAASAAAPITCSDMQPVYSQEHHRAVNREENSSEAQLHLEDSDEVQLRLEDTMIEQLFLMQATVEDEMNNANWEWLLSSILNLVRSRRIQAAASSRLLVQKNSFDSPAQMFNMVAG